MTLTLRADSQDVLMELEVVRDNEYRLPDAFASDDVIVDVGANVGGFAYACLRRGCGRILCYEPEPESFALLKQNTAAWDGAELHQQAVWRAGQQVTLYTSPWPYTAMHQTWPDKGPPCDTVAFADVLKDAGPKVKLLKIDCEGAERPILDSVESLDSVERVVGELHYTLSEDRKRYPSDAWLADRLRRFGFRRLEIVHSKTHPQLVSLFFAER